MLKIVVVLPGVLFIVMGLRLISNFLAERLRGGIVIFFLTLLVVLPFLVAYRYKRSAGG